MAEKDNPPLENTELVTVSPKIVKNSEDEQDADESKGSHNLEEQKYNGANTKVVTKPRSKRLGVQPDINEETDTEDVRIKKLRKNSKRERSEDYKKSRVAKESSKSVDDRKMEKKDKHKKDDSRKRSKQKDVKYKSSSNESRHRHHSSSSSSSSSSSGSESRDVGCIVVGKLTEDQLKSLVKSYGYRLINEEEYTNLVRSVKRMEKQLFNIISSSSSSCSSSSSHHSDHHNHHSSSDSHHKHHSHSSSSE